MNERETERLLLSWLATQRGAEAPAELRARVVAIPSVVGVPWAERLGRALGIVSGPQARSRRLVLLAVLAALLVALAGAAFQIGSRQQLAVVTPTPLPVAPSTSPVASVAPPTLEPIPSGDTSCLNSDLLGVVAGGTASADASVPAVPAGGRFAYVVLGKTNADGLAVDAQIRIATSASVTTVATVTSSRPFGVGNMVVPGNLDVVGWAPDGTSVLVYAGRWSPSVWFHNCANLYLVRADGSSVLPLTDNGRPGYDVEGRAFYRRIFDNAMASSDGSVVYRETTPDAGSFRVRAPSGSTSVVSEPPCMPDYSLFALTGDGQQLAIGCSSSLVLVSVADGSTTAVDLHSQSITARIAWSAARGRFVVALQGSTFAIAEVDPVAGSSTNLASIPDRPDLTALQFSPDSTKLLVDGCSPANRSDPRCSGTELDVFDVATGALRTIWSGPENDLTGEAIYAARWRADGVVVLPDPVGSGTIVVDPATGRATHSAWSIDALLWVPGK